MDLVETAARLVTLISAVSILATGLVVLAFEHVRHRGARMASRGGPLASVNFLGMGGFGVLGAVCAVTEWGTIGVPDVAGAPVRLLGWAVLIAAGVLAVLGLHAMGRNIASRVEVRADTSLVTSGPFAVVRHPLYLSILLLWAGGALALVSWPLAVGLAVLIPLFVARARQEESLLVEHFGDAYREYRRRVPMLLPLSPW